jgi:hypothetical protein
MGGGGPPGGPAGTPIAGVLGGGPATAPIEGEPPGCGTGLGGMGIWEASAMTVFCAAFAPCTAGGGADPESSPPQPRQNL